MLLAEDELTVCPNESKPLKINWKIEGARADISKVLFKAFRVMKKKKSSSNTVINRRIRRQFARQLSDNCRRTTSLKLRSSAY